MAIKIFGMGFFLNEGAYLRDYWNFMDIAIVIFSWLPLIFNNRSNSSSF